MKLKQVDDVLGGKAAWANVDKMPGASSSSMVHPRGGSLIYAVVCTKCDHKGAYYRQVQIRSADEPTTTF